MKIVKQIVLNRCYGGFSLSKQAWELYLQAKGLPCSRWDWGHPMDAQGCHYPDPERDDPVLIDIVEKLGNNASGQCSNLEVATVTVTIDLSNFDGKESVASAHAHTEFD